ncbi:MAG TPA: hypothetical protein VFZ53_02810 [Polyangiaceae bacterium]
MKSSSVALLTSLGACVVAACSTHENGRNPPVFGGEGAVVAKEQPLEPAAAEPPPYTGPCKGLAPASDTALFDDFEDGDNKPFKGFEREGWWWTATDTTPDATVLPAKGTFAAERLPAAEATNDNLFAAHFAASGQKEWGAVWGSTLAWTNGGIKCPFNASAFAGVALRAKGKGPIRLTFGLPETIGADGGGQCKERCYDSHGKVLFLTAEWQTFSVPWDKLQQEGWGAQARFDPGRLIQIGFKAAVQDLPVDLWVDDIRFVPKAEAAPKGP